MEPGQFPRSAVSKEGEQQYRDESGSCAFGHVAKDKPTHFAVQSVAGAIIKINGGSTDRIDIRSYKHGFLRSS